jgi:hypothetical protein
MIACMILAAGVRTWFALVLGSFSLVLGISILTEIWKPPDHRRRWNRDGSGPSVSRFGLVTWGICSLTGGTNLILSPFALVPQPIAIWSSGAALGLVIVAAIHDGVRASWSRKTERVLKTKGIESSSRNE